MDRQEGTEPTILLVEDNPQDIALTLLAFEANAFANTVVVAQNGSEALDYLFSNQEDCHHPSEKCPNLILLDIDLPNLNGLEVLKRIRSNQLTRLLPVVMLTTSVEETDVIESYENGANAFVQKPMNFEDLVNTIKHIGLFWLNTNRYPSLVSV